MAEASQTKRTADVACTVCGCVCDDLTVTTRDNRVTDVGPDCRLAQDWFLNATGEDARPCRIDGRAVDYFTAVEKASSILGGSVAPLIYGLSRSSTPGQRAAVRLADRLGATIDTTASTCHAPSIVALQTAGESTSTLGEVRNRSDLVIYWGSNPVVSHPRHMQRCLAPGQFVPEGRAGRHVVVVDVERTETVELADEWIRVEPGGDLELIWALRGLLRGQSLDQTTVAGVDYDTLVRFADRLAHCTYGSVFFGLGLTRGDAPHASVEGLLRLVTDLNSHTRFVARRMRIPGDVAGADSVLCWQTGFPFSVNLARGYPRYNPDEYNANRLLERREVDAALLVGSEGVAKLSPPAQRHLHDIPTIVLDYPGVNCPFSPTVHFSTSIYGVHRGGTAYRMDEVPIPLRPFLTSPLPDDDTVLSEIQRRL